MHKVTHIRKRNPWADRDELLHRCRVPRHNHLYQLLWLLLMGFACGGGSNFGFLHWRASSPLQHSRTTVRVCDARKCLSIVWLLWVLTRLSSPFPSLSSIPFSLPAEVGPFHRKNLRVSRYLWTPQGQKLWVFGHCGHQWVDAYGLHAFICIRL